MWETVSSGTDQVFPAAHPALQACWPGAAARCQVLRIICLQMTVQLLVWQVVDV